MRATVLEGPRTVTVENVPDPVLPRTRGRHRDGRAHRHLRIRPAPVPRRADRVAASGSVTRPSGPWPRSGPHVRSLKQGDRVLVSGVIGCGMCRPAWPASPTSACNDKTAAFGTVPDLPGGQAEAMAVPFADLFALPIPDGIADEEAVLLTDILPTGYLGALRADIRPGDRGRGGARARRHHGAAVRLALRPGAHPGRRHGARAAGPGRAPRGRADRRPHRTGRAPGAGGHRRAGCRVRDRGGRRGRHHRGRRVLRRHRAAPSRSSG